MALFNFGKQTEDPTVEIGSTGLKNRGGIINEEFLPQLRGTKAAKIFVEMRDNDAVVGAILFAIDMLVRQVKWSASPASQDAADVDNAAFLSENMNDMSQPWEAVISEIMTMLPFGYTPLEQVFKARNGEQPQDSDVASSRFNDGKIGWRKLPIRAQETIQRWLFDDNGGIQGLVQMAEPRFTPVTIPIEKLLLFRTVARKGNPEGRSILRNAYRSWFHKKRIEEIEGIGIERDLAGLPIAWLPAKYLSSKATAEEKQVAEEFKEIVINTRRDKMEGLTMPLVYDDKGNKLFDFTLLSTGGRRQFDTNKIIDRYDRRIAMTVLADFILLGHEKVGSFALASSKTDLFAIALSA